MQLLENANAPVGAKIDQGGQQPDLGSTGREHGRQI